MGATGCQMQPAYRRRGPRRHRQKMTEQMMMPQLMLKNHCTSDDIVGYLRHRSRLRGVFYFLSAFHLPLPGEAQHQHHG